MSLAALLTHDPFVRTPIDPFADEGDPLDVQNDVGSQQNYIHIRIQQRNGRKTLTTLQGLPKGQLILPLPPSAAADRHLYIQSMMLRSC